MDSVTEVVTAAPWDQVNWGGLTIVMVIILAIGIAIAPLFIWGCTHSTARTLKDIDATIRRLERLADKWEARQSKG